MATRYTVIWNRALVENDLAALVLSLMQRGQSLAPLTQAMSEIDRCLAADPSGEVESRTEYERVLIVSPLTVIYEIHEDEKMAGGATPLESATTRSNSAV